MSNMLRYVGIVLVGMLHIGILCVCGCLQFSVSSLLEYVIVNCFWFLFLCFLFFNVDKFNTDVIFLLFRIPLLLITNVVKPALRMSVPMCVTRGCRIVNDQSHLRFTDITFLWNWLLLWKMHTCMKTCNFPWISTYLILFAKIFGFFWPSAHCSTNYCQRVISQAKLHIRTEDDFIS